MKVTYLPLLLVSTLILSACYTNNYDVQSGVDNTDTNTYTIESCRTDIVGLRSYADAVGNSISLMSYLDMKGNEKNTSTVAAGKYGPLTQQGVIVDNRYFTTGNNDDISINIISVDLSSKNTVIVIGSDRMSLLTYSNICKTFYAVKHGANWGPPDTLITFTIKNNTIVNEKIIGTLPAYIISLTCNQQNGDIYLLNRENNTQLYKYANGTLTSIELSNVRDHGLQGLCYNSTDNMLYATLTVNYGTRITTIVSINPANGYVSLLRDMPVRLGIDIFSTTLDECNNNYILTGVDLSEARGNFISVYNCKKHSLSTQKIPYFLLWVSNKV